jgi:hypothetical protein
MRHVFLPHATQELRGAQGMSEEQMRALAEDVMVEEMWQEVDPVPEVRARVRACVRALAPPPAR